MGSLLEDNVKLKVSDTTIKTTIYGSRYAKSQHDLGKSGFSEGKIQFQQMVDGRSISRENRQRWEQA